MLPDVNGRASDPARRGAGEGTAPFSEPVAFFKLTGSGNDFVFFDARGDGAEATRWMSAQTPALIRAVCDRRNGVGADGVVLLDAPTAGGVRIAYYNSDGGRATLCGNATLCAARLAAHLGAAPADGGPFPVHTDAGRITARVPARGDPAILLDAATDLQTDAADVRRVRGESAIGYARVGVPHLVVRVPDADAVDLAARGAALRAPAPGREDGANVNFVSRRADGRWRMRTFERGVEGETLACGTGAVAAATLISAWDGTRSSVELATSSGRIARVTVRATDDGRRSELAGEGRLVYAGHLIDLTGSRM